MIQTDNTVIPGQARDDKASLALPQTDLYTVLSFSRGGGIGRRAGFKIR